MFVFAADDVSKKDLKKISKRIEKQLEKWEKLGEKGSKRKRDENDDGSKPGTSKETEMKKLRVDDIDDISEKEIQSSSNVDTSLTLDKDSQRQTVIKHKDETALDNVVMKLGEVNNINEECELVVDINEEGSCSFEIVSEGPCLNVEETASLRKKVPEEPEVIDVLSEEDCFSLVSEGPCLNEEDFFSLVSEGPRLNAEESVNLKHVPEELELIVDISEDGQCDIKVAPESKTCISPEAEVYKASSMVVSKCSAPFKGTEQLETNILNNTKTEVHRSTKHLETTILNNTKTEVHKSMKHLETTLLNNTKTEHLFYLCTCKHQIGSKPSDSICDWCINARSAVKTENDLTKNSQKTKNNQKTTSYICSDTTDLAPTSNEIPVSGHSCIQANAVTNEKLESVHGKTLQKDKDVQYKEKTTVRDSVTCKIEKNLKADSTNVTVISCENFSAHLPVSNSVDLTVEDDSVDLTVEEDPVDLTVKNDPVDLTVEDDSVDLTVEDDSVDLSVESADKSSDIIDEDESSGLIAEENTWTTPNECDIVALDCEFVGVTRNGRPNQSALGRCSIVDFYGTVICDIYARPEEKIMDYRTRWSGLTKNHMKKAIPIQSALSQIANIIKDKVVIGHAVHNDFQVLRIPHSRLHIRDTSFCQLLRKKFDPAAVDQKISLKRLALQLLGRKIQTGQHCSIEDATAALDLYKLVREEWEKVLLHERPTLDVSIEDNKDKDNPKTEKNRAKRQRAKLNRLKRIESSMALQSSSTSNESKVNGFRRSKSDSKLYSQWNGYYNGYGNTRTNLNGDQSKEGYSGCGWKRKRVITDNNGWTAGRQAPSNFAYWDGQYLEDEYWQGWN